MDYFISNLNTYGQFIAGWLFGILFVVVDLTFEELFFLLRDHRKKKERDD